MSQQTQAEGLHATGVQQFEEARTRLVTLHEKHAKGELSAEALASESQEVDRAINAATATLARAEQLNTIDRGITKLQGFDDEPLYVGPAGKLAGRKPAGGDHPGGDNGQTPLAEQLSALLVEPQNLGMDERQRSAVAKMAGVSDPKGYRVLSGRERNLVGRYLRESVTKKDAGHPDRLSRKDHQELVAASQKREDLGLSPYIDRDGGAIVAHEVRNEVIGYLRDRRHIRSKARVIPTNAASVAFPTMRVKVPLKPTRAHKGKVDGSGARTVRDILGKTEFTPKGKAEVITVPEELVEDATFDIIGFIAEEIALEAFDGEEIDFLTGNGVSEPYGVLTAPISGVDHTGASGALFAPEDLKTLPLEIREIFRTSGAWMANRAFYRRAVTLRDETGGAGTGQFLFTPGLAAGMPATLAGYEAMESEFFPDNVTSGSDGDPLALFGDWRQYWIVERLGLEVRMLMERYADELQIGVRFRKRLDGAPVRLEAFVTLDRK